MGEFISRVLVELDKMFDYLLIASAVVAVIAGAAIDNDKEDVLDKAQQRLKDLAKTTKLDREVSFRCCMFFPDPKNPDGLPVSPLLVFNSSWPAEECSTAPDYDRYSIFCKNLFSQFSNKLSLKDPSIRKENRDKGSTIVMTSAASSREMLKLLLLVARRVRSSRRVSRFPCSPMLVEMKPGRILDIITMRRFAAELQSTFLVKKLITNISSSNHHDHRPLLPPGY